MSVILAWIPNEKSICPSSIASYFDSLKYKVHLGQPKFESRTNYSVQVPILDISSNVKYCTNAELLEWIGIHSIGASLDMENYDYLSSYQIPEQNTTFGQVLYLKATGFYSASQVLEIFDAIRSYSSSRPHLPWISLHVQGFHDSPVSWGLKEHQFYTSGDNSYTIVIKPDDQFILQTIISSNKRPK
ncbi:ribonuclease P protein subunit p40-like [Ctenocephalides felis]|uniref:ribonuclease P protein subunit p40-like n=1 Tax=Ctenocephalides felis TaxID=7515 RepID=UPI000E6E4DE9|nr:ribonuclease P protein subunit p40-like [Ctenocephalides felis]